MAVGKDGAVRGAVAGDGNADERAGQRERDAVVISGRLVRIVIDGVHQ
jgi:hypothetical protein